MGTKPIFFGSHKAAVSAVAFDKDGTLFEAVSFWRYIDGLRKAAFVAQVGEEHAAAWGQLMGITDGDVDHAGVLAVATMQEEITMVAGLIYQLKAWPWVRCKQVAAAIFQTADAELEVEQAFRRVAGVPAIFDKLAAAGLYTGILTSDSAPRTERCLDMLKVRGQMDFIVTPESVRNGKPDPEMVHTACERLGIRPGELAVVGDSVVDMRMARQAGSLAVGIITYEGSEAELAPEADMLIRSIEEIGFEQ